MSPERMDKPSFPGTGTGPDYTRAVADAQFASPIPLGRVNARPVANREAQIAHDADRRGEGRAFDTPSVDCTSCRGGVAIRCSPDFASGVMQEPWRQCHAQRKRRWRKIHPATTSLPGYATSGCVHQASDYPTGSACSSVHCQRHNLRAARYSHPTCLADSECAGDPDLHERSRR
jgi:hypothetical protein